MKSTIDYAAEAADDLERIRQRSIDEFGHEIAERAIITVLGAIRKTVAMFPACGRLRPELGQTVRSYPIPPYIVFYSTNEHSIRILRILHGKRNIHNPLMSLLLAG
jgi:toxin ParE1/3/4